MISSDRRNSRRSSQIRRCVRRVLLPDFLCEGFQIEDGLAERLADAEHRPRAPQVVVGAVGPQPRAGAIVERESSRDDSSCIARPSQ